MLHDNDSGEGYNLNKAKVKNTNPTFSQSMGYLITLVVILSTWFTGIVLASGFWQTLFALCPMYAWYLVVEKVLKQIGWV